MVVGGADVLFRDGSGGVGGRYVYKRNINTYKMTEMLHIILTLAKRDLDVVDSFVLEEITNRFDP
jgi:hypothetical protein